MKTTFTARHFEASTELQNFAETVLRNLNNFMIEL